MKHQTKKVYSNTIGNTCNYFRTRTRKERETNKSKAYNSSSTPHRGRATKGNTKKTNDSTDRVDYRNVFYSRRNRLAIIATAVLA